MNPCRIGIAGCTGRMGRMLLAEVLDTDGAVLAGGVSRGLDYALSDLGELAGARRIGITTGTDIGALFQAADVIIDFTTPDATIRNAEIAASQGKALIIGTTGLDSARQASIVDASAHAPILQAANMSLGVNLLLGLTEQVARTLGIDWDIEIVEMHHRHKVDAPSGTALALGQAAASGRSVALDDVSVRSRDGQTGARKRGDIGFATLRGGDVVGEHSVVFAGTGERIELAHKATDRRIFARGAVRAAMWLAGRPPGLYSMKDVLGLS